jgi:parallel beta-helix repeat protein
MCTDTDGDGICDDPYILTTNNIDLLPLTKPEVPPRTIYVNEIGWWIEPDPVNPSATPIQSAVSNANAGDTIIVHDGTYTENVDVLEQLTIRSANGSANCIVSAADIADHVFDIYMGHVNISGFTIRGGATEGKAGIYLNKGVSHCRISNNNCTQNHRGISLYFADSNTIIDNTADSNCWYGIYLYKSDNNHVINNSARFNEIYMGICITYSDYNYLVGNTANHNGWEGIRLYHSDNSVVSGNNVNYNNLTDVGTGLLSWASNNAIMTDNIARQNAYGIYLYSASSNNTVINNIASECEAHGILVYQSSNATICDNDANNNGYHGIFVYDSPTSNITICNNTASNNFYHGIFAAYGPSNLKIMGNTMINNGVSDTLGCGIYMGAGSGAIISDNYIAENTASNQAHGIKVFSFTNVAIHGNTIVNNCDYGFMLDSVSGSGTMAGLASGIEADDDDMPVIENEGVAAAQPTALALPDGDYSSAMLPPRSRQVGAGFPTGVNVSENMITDNADGIWVNVSDNVMIAGNIVTNNGIGVNLTSSDDNIIYNNYFDNTNNAYDDGTNEWNTTSTSGENIIGGSWLGGNYWGDYIGVDNNEDGLGDTMRPYNSSGNIKQGGDWHPLVEVATSLPDLKITDIWVCWPENCTICYNVTNVGTGTAQAGHNTSLLVDGTEVAYDCVTEALSHNESYIGCFDYMWVYTPLEDNITVCADCNNTVSESNEGNNFRTKKWICGDPNEDGSVDTTDVIAVWDYFIAGVPLKNKWAADTALDNGVIDTNDVIAIWNNYVSGSVLNCSCSG